MSFSPARCFRITAFHNNGFGFDLYSLAELSGLQLDCHPSPSTEGRQGTHVQAFWLQASPTTVDQIQAEWDNYTYNRVCWGYRFRNHAGPPTNMRVWHDHGENFPNSFCPPVAVKNHTFTTTSTGARYFLTCVAANQLSVPTDTFNFASVTYGTPNGTGVSAGGIRTAVSSWSAAVSPGSHIVDVTVNNTNNLLVPQFSLWKGLYAFTMEAVVGQSIDFIKFTGSNNPGNYEVNGSIFPLHTLLDFPQTASPPTYIQTIQGGDGLLIFSAAPEFYQSEVVQAAVSMQYYGS